MIVRPEDVPAREFYRLMTGLVTPRPIAWVSTLSADGRANLAPYSFFNAVSANPPAVMFSPTNRRDGSVKDTLRNIEATREFVVNVVSHPLVPAMNATAAEVGPEVDEFEFANLEKLPSTVVGPPRVARALAAMECVLHSVVKLGPGPLAGNVVIGLIRAMHVSDALLGADGAVDATKIDTVGRLGGNAYSTTRDRFDLERPG